MRDISLYLSTIPDYNQMLAGKNVLITTAARGIGKSIALLLSLIHISKRPTPSARICTM